MTVFQGKTGRWFVKKFSQTNGKLLPEAELPEFATKEQAESWVDWRETGFFKGKHPDRVRVGLKSAGIKRPNRKGRKNGA